MTNIVYLVVAGAVVVIVPWIVVWIFATKSQRTIYTQWFGVIGDFSSAGNSGLGGLGNFAAAVVTAVGGMGFMIHMLFTRRKYRIT